MTSICNLVTLFCGTKEAKNNASLVVQSKRKEIEVNLAVRSSTSHMLHQAMGLIRVITDIRSPTGDTKLSLLLARSYTSQVS